MKQWQYRFPPFKETVVVGAFIVLFLLLTGLCIGLGSSAVTFCFVWHFIRLDAYLSEL